MKKILKTLLLIILIGLGPAAHAAVNGPLQYQPLEPLPFSAGGQAPNTYTDIAAYLNYTFPILIALVAFIAVVVITINGVRYMMADILTAKDLARRRIWASIWALIIVLASVLILETVNPKLVQFDLLSSLKQLQAQSPQGAFDQSQQLPNQAPPCVLGQISTSESPCAP